MDKRSSVAIAKVTDIDSTQAVENAVREAVGLACDFKQMVAGKKVLLKPNVYCPSPAPTTTDPRVIAALIKLAKECGAKKVTVAEGRSVSTARYRKGFQTTRDCFKAVGMTEAVEAAGADIVYLEEDEFVTVDLPDALALKQASVPRAILEADVFINVPVFKNHSLTLITLGIKNLHGIVSDANKLFGHDYYTIPSKLTDLLRIRKINLTVIDGVRGLEGDHADMGSPVDTAVVFAGTDTVAVDATASSVMGLEPFEVDTTRIAHEQELGVGDLSRIDVLGNSIESVRKVFARPDFEISEERFPGLRVLAGKYCKGCEYYIRRGIDRLVEKGVLDPNDKLTLIFGENPDVSGELGGRVIILGKCPLKSESVQQLMVKLEAEGKLKAISDCPPMEFRMRALELAG
jgi:uncharacterized protein (DUF362 family)